MSDATEFKKSMPAVKLQHYAFYTLCVLLIFDRACLFVFSNNLKQERVCNERIKKDTQLLDEVKR